MTLSGKTIKQNRKQNNNFVYIVTAKKLVEMLPTTTNKASGLLEGTSEFSQLPNIGSEVIVLNNGNCVHGVLTKTGWVLNDEAKYTPTNLNNYSIEKIAICLKANGEWNRNTTEYSVDKASDVSKLPTTSNKASGDFEGATEFANTPTLGSLAVVNETADIYILTHIGWVKCTNGVDMELMNYAKKNVANGSIKTKEPMNIISTDDVTIQGSSVKIESMSDNVDINSGNNINIEASGTIILESASNSVEMISDSGNVKMASTNGEVILQSQKIGSQVGLLTINSAGVVSVVGNFNHNSVCRDGVELTDRYDVSDIVEMVEAGDFSDIYVGDTITVDINSSIGGDEKVELIVAGINLNNRMAISDGEDDYDCDWRNHIALITKDCFKTTAKMNTTNTAADGYYATDMYKNTLPAYVSAFEDVFGRDHLFAPEKLVCGSTDFSQTGYGDINYFESDYMWSSEEDWADYTNPSKLQLLTEMEVYGQHIYNHSINGCNYYGWRQQLPIFRFRPDLIACGFGYHATSKSWYWLQDVAGSASFSRVYSYGGCGYGRASDSGGVRPLLYIG